MSYYATNRKPEAESPYQSVETSPSHSRSTSFESFQSAVLRGSSSVDCSSQPSARPLSNLPNASSTAHDLTSMHHDPCIKVIQTSPSSVSLDKLAAHMHSSYSSLPPVPSSLAEFQSLPANIQHHHQQSSASSSGCKTSTSMSAALAAAARPLVHNVQDLESSFTSLSSSNGQTATVKSLIDNAVDEHMRQYQPKNTQSSASSAMSFIDEILSTIKPTAASSTAVPVGEEQRTTTTTPNKATSESATQQSSVRSPDLTMNKSAQSSSSLSAPMSYAHHVNTLSPNGSTINDAVAIFNLANAAASSSTQASTSEVKCEPVSSSSSESKVVKNLEMSLSSASTSSSQSVSEPPVATINKSESVELAVKQVKEEEEKKKPEVTKTTPTPSESSPASPSAKKEKDSIKSSPSRGAKTEKVKKEEKEKKDEKKDKSEKKKSKNETAGSINVSVASSSVKSESKKKEKKESKKENKENSNKEQQVKSVKDEKKQSTNTVKTTGELATSTAQTGVSAPLKDNKDAAPKSQREKPAKKSSSSTVTSNKKSTKDNNTLSESSQQQQQPKSNKTTSHEGKDSDKRPGNNTSNKKKADKSHETKKKLTGERDDESSNGKSDELIQMLLAKLEKMNSSSSKSSSSQSKQTALINRIKYQPGLLQRIRDERHEFIATISPDIFKAYSYCMDGRHWNPEHYFDIVQSDGDYDKIKPGKRTFNNNKPTTVPNGMVYPQSHHHHNNQYSSHPAAHHQQQPINSSSQYFKTHVNNMTNNRRKFYDNSYHGGQQQQQQYQNPHYHQQQQQYQQRPYHHQYQQYNNNQQYVVENHQSPEMPQVPRNSPKSVSEHNTAPHQTKPQSLDSLGLTTCSRGSSSAVSTSSSSRPEQHIFNMLGVKREDEDSSRLMHLLNNSNRPSAPQQQTSHYMIENLLLAPKEAPKSNIMTAHEFEMMQLKSSSSYPITNNSIGYGLGDSDALRQLVKNLDNHPLSAAVKQHQQQQSQVDNTSQFLKQMLRIPQPESSNESNRLLASVNARQNKEKEDFQSLVLNKLMPTSVSYTHQPAVVAAADNIMKWFH